MTYIDGFVIPCPEANRDRFIEHARQGDAVFMELGALRIVECWGDDIPDGHTTDFRRAVKAEDGEAVLFSWIEWPDKATRDAGAEKVMKDERMQPKEGEDMPFVGARLIYGGFEVLLDAKG